MSHLLKVQLCSMILYLLKDYACVVKYITNLTEHSRNVRGARSRQYIWSFIKKNKFEDVGCYQPEDDGYEVLSIDQGNCLYL